MAAQEDGVIRAQRHRVDLVLTFEVHDHELRTLQDGESVGVDLTVAVALLSVAASAAFTLATATFDSPTVKLFAIASLFPGIPVGLYFAYRCHKLGKKNKGLCETIRKRRADSSTATSENAEQTATAVPDKLPTANSNVK